MSDPAEATKEPTQPSHPGDAPRTADPSDSPRKMRFLNIIAWVAIVDVVLLIPLVWASRWVAHNEAVVGVLGPIHGFLFIILIGLCAYGSIQKWWGWWFPVLVVVTLGPIGSLVGDWIIRRQIKAEAGQTA